MLDYPERGDNLAPYGGTAADWRQWVEEGPIARAFGVTCPAVEPGRAVLELVESPIALNPIGSVHGGIVAAIADHAMGVVFMSTMPRGLLPATASLTVEYHRPAFLPLTFTARVTSSGRTMLFCEVEVTGGDGKVSNRCHGIMAVRGEAAVR
jgi:uncharacterized protein (TIGR00369 family)